MKNTCVQDFALTNRNIECNKCPNTDRAVGADSSCFYLYINLKTTEPVFMKHGRMMKEF